MLFLRLVRVWMSTQQRHFVYLWLIFQQLSNKTTQFFLSIFSSNYYTQTHSTQWIGNLHSFFSLHVFTYHGTVTATANLKFYDSNYTSKSTSSGESLNHIFPLVFVFCMKYFSLLLLVVLLFLRRSVPVLCSVCWHTIVFAWLFGWCTLNI